jgi:ferredoxin-type protein NapH
MEFTVAAPAKAYGHSRFPEIAEKGAIIFVGAGIALLLAALTGAGSTFFVVGISLLSAGALLFSWGVAAAAPAGIKNNKVFFNSISRRGLWGYLIGVVITGFYVLLYWFPESLSAWVRSLDGLSQWLRGEHADRWFLYGFLYTLSVVIMGIRMIVKYRHNRYQILRTLSVMFFQTGFAFIVPGLLSKLNEPEYYFTYFWPLKYQYLFPDSVHALVTGPGSLGYFMVVWGAVMTFIATPVLTYFYGKRWYCSWVCGCGGLAETAGDPFRQLSDKSLKAWEIERWMIHSVLAFVIMTTGLLWVNSASQGSVLGDISQTFAHTYGFVIGALFSGIIGVGFYPILGSRVWCRFGCPMAAYLGILQKVKSRFRITVNGDQCISCGNCSTYCEMGIDVRWYAQRGQNIIRSSCVGCGICSAVCPRGVLKLENGPEEGRFNRP